MDSPVYHQIKWLNKISIECTCMHKLHGITVPSWGGPRGLNGNGKWPNNRNGDGKWPKNRNGDGNSEL